ncbi:MAG: hypothetical protein DLM64_13940 [Solirubrobacterales bacterium]|nr:MAG: hypothetical protein DLM64_13940 [Solirubrobacterales bacterium]
MGTPAPPRGLARCSIVIPVHNRSDLTRRCIDVLIEQQLEHTQLVVVDDASSDATATLLASYHDRIAVCSLASNLGFAGACNTGAAAATGELLVFLNNDTVPVDGWLAALIAYIDRNPQAAVVGAKLLWPDNVVQHAGIVFTPQGWPHPVYRGFPSDHPAVNRSRAMRAVTGACMLVRRQAFEQVGGFDTAFRNGYEDVDLCLRIGERGGEIHYCHQAVVYHLESATRALDSHDDETGQNLGLLLDRWRDRVQSDDLSRYVQDGVIELHYEGPPHPIAIKVDPCLASVAAKEADNTLPRLLNMRTRQVFELLRELRRDAPALPAEGSDGAPVVFPANGDRMFDQPVPEEKVSGDVVRVVDFLEHRIAPLALELARTEPERLNVLLSSFDTDHVFGAYMAAYQLVMRLRDAHRALRIVALDDDMTQGADTTRARIHAFEGLTGALSGVELVGMKDRSRKLAVNPADRFIATTSWSAHVAHAASRQLGRARFLHLIQEYDPIAFPNGSFQAIAQQAYALPQVAVFSSSLLRDFFADQEIGVYQGGRAAGDELSLAFENAITDVGAVTADALSRRAPRRMLVYARPQATEARNMLELAVMSLRAAIRTGVLASDFELTGVGRPGTGRGAIPLAGRTWLEMIPKQPIGRYRGLLRTHQLGLSLMHTPHPSLVPLEMAAAGMPVVTTTYATKTPARMAALSPNIIAVAPSVEAVVAGLRTAVERAASPELCAEGADVRWSRSWRETFDNPTIAALDRLLARCDER